MIHFSFPSDICWLFENVYASPLAHADAYTHAFVSTCSFFFFTCVEHFFRDTSSVCMFSMPWRFLLVASLFALMSMPHCSRIMNWVGLDLILTILLSGLIVLFLLHLESDSKRIPSVSTSFFFLPFSFCCCAVFDRDLASPSEFVPPSICTDPTFVQLISLYRGRTRGMDYHAAQDRYFSLFDFFICYSSLIDSCISLFGLILSISIDSCYHFFGLRVIFLTRNVFFFAW